MRLNVNLPRRDVRFLDLYVQSEGITSRSAALQRAVELLRAHELSAAYEEAWREWDDEGAPKLWNSVLPDGISAG